MKTTSVFAKNIEAYNLGYRAIINKGSTRSSKSWSILQLLYLIACCSPKPLIISIVSESMPHLKKGCIRDFETMLKNEGKWSDKSWNATDKIYKVNHSILEFFSADSAGKVHGPARDILFVNECINIPYETYRQLAIRTRQTIFLDFNPCFEFWADEYVIPKEESILIHSTYKDNEMLTEAQVQEIESNKDNDPDWFNVYGLGLTGNKTGLIMQNWDICLNMPETYKHRWFGLDFGFTNDPTALVDVRLSQGELYINEILYEKRYDNMMISDRLKDVSALGFSIIADSAEPKSISEIRSKGLNVEPALKGRDSILSGISILNRYNKHITQHSVNVIKEYRNYRWKSDEYGKPTNTPIDMYNHSIDAQRYVALNKLAEKRLPCPPKARTIKMV